MREEVDAIVGSLFLSMKKKGSANGDRGAAEKRGMLKIPPAKDEVLKNLKSEEQIPADGNIVRALCKTTQ